MEQPPAIIRQVEAQIDYGRMVSCLLQVEGTPWNKFGGALGFTTAAWKEETGLPFKLSSHEPTARIIAQQRLAKIAARFTSYGVKVTPEALAGAWKHGPTGALNRIKRGRNSDYMQRAGNLYRDPNFSK